MAGRAGREFAFLSGMFVDGDRTSRGDYPLARPIVNGSGWLAADAGMGKGGLLTALVCLAGVAGGD